MSEVSIVRILLLWRKKERRREGRNTSGGAGGGENENRSAAGEEGEPLPSFAVKTLDGTTISAKHLEGKVVLGNSRGTWCLPCVKEAPPLQEIHEKWNEEGLVILGLALGDTGNRSSGNNADKPADRTPDSGIEPSRKKTVTATFKVAKLVQREDML